MGIGETILVVVFAYVMCMISAGAVISNFDWKPRTVILTVVFWWIALLYVMYRALKWVVWNAVIKGEGWPGRKCKQVSFVSDDPELDSKSDTVVYEDPRRD